MLHNIHCIRDEKINKEIAVYVNATGLSFMILLSMEEQQWHIGDNGARIFNLGNLKIIL